ncbi:MAG: zf-HC2 domain-containing protein [Chloroflexi bacterium]|nr:zf-HC2 domain-containing protein [Chloroflexota bacterium]
MAQLTDHIRAGELFSAYIDQRTTADERAFVERHVAACADCRAQLQATRSMVAALKAMPVVKAPRSFVLPKSMAVQPKPSIFNWYPTLRLATAFAAIAFVLVFAGDLLTVRPNGGGNVVMSVQSAAPAAEAPAAPPAPAQPVEPMAKSAPPDQQPPSAEPAPAGAAPAAPAAGDVARAQPTATLAADATNAAALSMQAAPTETIAADVMTDTVEATATTTLAYAVEPTSMPAAESAVEAPAAEPTPGPAVEEPTPAIAAPPAVDPLRLVSIVLGGLVVLLGAATLIIRRGV